MTIYERIRHLRILHDWSQEQVAYKCGYTSRSMIARVEKGQIDLPVSKIFILADLFGVTPEYLLTGKETDEERFSPFYEKKNRIIYAIQHNATGRVYVGCTTNLEKRYFKHLWDLKSGRHNSAEMQKDYDDHGEDYSVFILERINNRDFRSNEWRWMEALKTFDDDCGYNKQDHHFRHRIPIKEGIPQINK